MKCAITDNDLKLDGDVVVTKYTQTYAKRQGSAVTFTRNVVNLVIGLYAKGAYLCVVVNSWRNS